MFQKNSSPAGESGELSPRLIVLVTEDDESDGDLLRRGFLEGGLGTRPVEPQLRTMSSTSRQMGQLTALTQNDR